MDKSAMIERAQTPKPLTPKQAEAHIKAAFDMERAIIKAASHVTEAWWELSEKLYIFHEQGYWAALGHESLDDFLAQPELGMSRSQFFQMTKLWRDLVVVKQISPEIVKEIEPSKATEVTPSIMRGEVKAEDAFDDARTLGYRDIKEKYRKENRDRHGQKPDDSTPLDADREPERLKCDKCGSWYLPDAA